MKFHFKQFQQILSVTKPAEEEKAVSEDKDEEDEEDGDNDDGSDDNDYGEYGYDDDDEDEDEEEEKEEEKTEEKKFDIKDLFKTILPVFLFKWGGEIEITPDLPEVKNLCNKNQEESFLLKSFRKIVQ